MDAPNAHWSITLRERQHGPVRESHWTDRTTNDAISSWLAFPSFLSTQSTPMSLSFYFVRQRHDWPNHHPSAIRHLICLLCSCSEHPTGRGDKTDRQTEREREVTSICFTQKTVRLCLMHGMRRSVEDCVVVQLSSSVKLWLSSSRPVYPLTQPQCHNTLKTLNSQALPKQLVSQV